MEFTNLALLFAICFTIYIVTACGYFSFYTPKVTTPETKKMASVRLCFLVFLFGGSGYSITFNVEPGTKKCVKDEVHKDVLVLGQFSNYIVI